MSLTDRVAMPDQRRKSWGPFRRPGHLALRAVLFGLILLFFAQLAFGSTQLSLTSDEPPHIAHGYAMLTTGDTWTLKEHRHPPLLNMWAAWPLLLQPERPDPTAITGWDADFVVFVRHLWPTLGPVVRQAYVTRLPNMLLGVILMALVFRWASRSFGITGALAAVALMSFDPTMIAHTQLATTDLGVALFSFAATLVIWRGALGAGTYLLTGALLGAALASKGSGVVLLPVVFLLLGWRHAVRHTTAPNGRLGVGSVAQWVGSSSLIAVVTLAVLWSTYGFRLETTRWPGVHLPLVAHANMVRLILSEKSRTAFLMGDVRQGGWWAYFPIAFLLKTPLPCIALALGGCFGLATRRRRLLEQLGVWVVPAVYGVTAVVSGMNIGYRHLLPIFPFIYIMVAHLVHILSVHTRRPPTARPSRTRLVARLGLAVVVPLLVWQGVEAARIYPFGLAYFNQLAGGPSQGYLYLVDSNVDWGHEFIALRDYLDRHYPGEEVALSYYTWIDPAEYGVRYHPIPPAGGPASTLPQPYDPLPGLYAISGTPLQGVMVADRDLYAWFREREPIAQPGYGLLVYNVKPHGVQPSWLAQCTQPLAPLSPEAITAGLGREHLRSISFDCTQGWIWPEGLATPGWYALHGSLRADPFPEAQVARTNAPLTYRQSGPGRLPPFDLYLQPQREAPEPDTMLTPPIDFGSLTLLGFTGTKSVVRPGTIAEITTWWRVDAKVDRSLSLMLHLGKPAEPPIAVGDGLAVPWASWEKGDILVQRHRLQVPEDSESGTYAAHTGVYWSESLERWPIGNGANTGADAFPLTSVDIQ